MGDGRHRFRHPSPKNYPFWGAADIIEISLDLQGPKLCVNLNVRMAGLGMDSEADSIGLKTILFVNLQGMRKSEVIFK